MCRTSRAIAAPVAGKAGAHAAVAELIAHAMTSAGVGAAGLRSGRQKRQRQRQPHRHHECHGDDLERSSATTERTTAGGSTNVFEVDHFILLMAMHFDRPIRIRSMRRAAALGSRFVARGAAAAGASGQSSLAAAALVVRYQLPGISAIKLQRWSPMGSHHRMSTTPSIEEVRVLACCYIETHGLAKGMLTVQYPYCY